MESVELKCETTIDSNNGSFISTLIVLDRILNVMNIYINYIIQFKYPILETETPSLQRRDGFIELHDLIHNDCIMREPSHYILHEGEHIKLSST